MSYSLDDVEAALAVSDNEDIKTIQQANDLINEWMESETVIQDIAVILSRNDNRYVRFKVSSGLQNKLQFLWGSLDDETRANVRQELVNQIQKMEDIEDVLGSISKCVAIIASFDLPENWDQFYEFCFANDDYTAPQIMSCLYILYYYCKEIDETTIITRKHKILERDTLNENMQQVFHTCELGFKDPITNPMALKCLNYFLKWSQFSELISEELVKKLLFEDMAVEESKKSAMECLTTIFIERNDAFIYFRRLSPYVLIALATSKDPTNPNLPITSAEDVKDFLTKFMTYFIDVIRVLNIEDPPPKEEEEDKLDFYSIEMNSLKEEPLSALSDMNVSPEDFNEMIVNLIHVIISTQTPSTSFWDFWCQIFRELSNDLFLSSSMSIRPTFMPLLPEIRESLYNLLPEASEERDGSCSSVARSCFSNLIQVDIEKMVEFLNQQDPSIALCYAISAVELCFQAHDIFDSLNSQIVTILQSVDDDSDEAFVCAFIFTCSTIILYIESDSQTYEEVIKFLIQSLSSDSTRITSAAASALSQVVTTSIDFLVANCSQLALDLVQYSESFVTNLDSQNMKLMFLTCTTLIVNSLDDKEDREAFETLFEPVYTVLQEFFENPAENLQECINACDVIQTCANYLIRNMYQGCLTEIFKEPLMTTLPNILNVIEFAQLSDYMLTAMARLICLMDTEESRECFAQVLEMLTDTREMNDSVFRFIAIVVAVHTEFVPNFGEYFTRFVEPAMSLDPPPFEAIAQMVQQFAESKDVPVEFLVALTTGGLDVLDTNANLAVIDCWNTFMICAFELERRQAMQQAIVSDVLPATFQAIVSMLHSSVYTELSEFFGSLVRFLTDMCPSPEDYVEVLNKTFNEIQPEPIENLYNQFLAFCFNAGTPKYKIGFAVTNLLATMRRSSPVDSDAFKIKKPKHSFFSMLLPLWMNNIFQFEPANDLFINRPLVNDDYSLFMPRVFSITRPKDREKEAKADIVDDDGKEE